MKKEGKKVYQVKENAVKGVYVSNLKELVCHDVKTAMGLLEKGLQRKQVSSTWRNHQSSRSHTMFQIKLYSKGTQLNTHLLPQYQKEIEEKVISKFSLIDLAGCEKIADQEKNPETRQEAIFINKSLSALSSVVSALRMSRKRVGS